MVPAGELMRKKILDFLRGNLARRTMLFVLVPLLSASYVGIMGIAALLYPEPYDWRFNSMSRLLYASDNPDYHHIMSFIVACSGGLMIPFAGYIRRRLMGIAPAAATVGAVVFFTGCVCLILSSLITSHPAHGAAHFPRLHDTLARLAAVGIAAGMVDFTICVTKGFVRPGRGEPLPRRSLLVSWNLLTAPVVFIVIAWLAIRSCLDQAGPVCRLIVTSAVWQVGFWEWLGVPVVILFLACAALFLPEDGPE